MRISKPVLSSLMVLGYASGLSAAVINYTAILNGGNEVPAFATAATGTILVSLNGTTLTVAETYTGLSNVPTGAHIHCCSAIGVNSGVAVPFTSFPGTTSGTYNQTFDLTLLSTYTAGFVTANGGTAAGAQAALIAGLANGLTYANIHDSVSPGGEIRGQLIPEPTTSVLMLLGLVPVIAAARRRGRKV